MLQQNGDILDILSRSSIYTLAKKRSWENGWTYVRWYNFLLKNGDFQCYSSSKIIQAIKLLLQINQLQTFGALPKQWNLIVLVDDSANCQEIVCHAVSILIWMYQSYKGIIVLCQTLHVLYRIWCHVFNQPFLNYWAQVGVSSEWQCSLCKKFQVGWMFQQ